MHVCVCVRVRDTHTEEYHISFIDEGLGEPPLTFSCAPIGLTGHLGKKDIWRECRIDMGPPPLDLGNSDGWSVFRKEVYVCARLSLGSCFLSSIWF